MYVITYNGLPASLQTLYTVENASNGAHYRTLSADELSSCIANWKKAACIEQYLRLFGFTWKERIKGVEVKKVKM